MEVQFLSPAPLFHVLTLIYDGEQVAQLPLGSSLGDKPSAHAFRLGRRGTCLRTPTSESLLYAPPQATVRILNLLAGCGVPWHTKSMSLMGKEAWRRLGGIGLLGAIALSGCGILHPSSSPPAASVANGSDPTVNSGVVQSLQRQIRERDKRIAELTSQLDALKVIDQDMQERRTSSRPPATLRPATTDQLR